MLLICRPRRDERLSWPGWLTCSGWLTHISGHPSAAGWAQDRESSLARDWRSNHWATVLGTITGLSSVSTDYTDSCQYPFVWTYPYFKPHRMHSIDVAYCYWLVAWPVCVFVCLSVTLILQKRPNRSRCRLSCGLWWFHHVLDWGRDFPPKRAIWGVGKCGHARACRRSIYSTKRCGLLSKFFNLLLVYNNL